MKMAPLGGSRQDLGDFVGDCHQNETPVGYGGD